MKCEEAKQNNNIKLEINKKDEWQMRIRYDLWTFIYEEGWKESIIIISFKQILICMESYSKWRQWWSEWHKYNSYIDIIYAYKIDIYIYMNSHNSLWQGRQMSESVNGTADIELYI